MKRLTPISPFITFLFLFIFTFILALQQFTHPELGTDGSNYILGGFILLITIYSSVLLFKMRFARFDENAIYIYTYFKKKRIDYSKVISCGLLAQGIIGYVSFGWYNGGAVAFEIKYYEGAKIKSYWLLLKASSIRVQQFKATLAKSGIKLVDEPY